MPEKDQFFWLFFRFSGRVSRAAYFLATVLVGIVPAFFLYQVLRYPEGTPGSELWALGFLLTFLASLWSNVAFSVKRLHDIGKPGLFAIALFIPVVSIIAFIALCVLPGSPGPNQYGQRTNAPARKT